MVKGELQLDSESPLDVFSAQHRAQTLLGAHRFMVVLAVCIDQRCLQIVSGAAALEIVKRLRGKPYVAACSCARDLVMYRFRIPPGASAMRPRGVQGTLTNMRRDPRGVGTGHGLGHQELPASPASPAAPLTCCSSTPGRLDRISAVCRCLWTLCSSSSCS